MHSRVISSQPTNVLTLRMPCTFLRLCLARIVSSSFALGDFSNLKIRTILCEGRRLICMQIKFGLENCCDVASVLCCVCVCVCLFATTTPNGRRLKRAGGPSGCLGITQTLGRRSRGRIDGWSSHSAHTQFQQTEIVHNEHCECVRCVCVLPTAANGLDHYFLLHIIPRRQ